MRRYSTSNRTTQSNSAVTISRVGCGSRSHDDGWRRNSRHRRGCLSVRTLPGSASWSVVSRVAAAASGEIATEFCLWAANSVMELVRSPKDVPPPDFRLPRHIILRF